MFVLRNSTQHKQPNCYNVVPIIDGVIFVLYAGIFVCILVCMCVCCDLCLYARNFVFMMVSLLVCCDLCLYVGVFVLKLGYLFVCCPWHLGPNAPGDPGSLAPGF